MKNLPLIASVLVGVLLIAGAVMLSGQGGAEEPIQNVFMEGDTQVIEITARGGYSPRATTATAGVPTVLRLKTKGTYDCSSALVIPSLNYRGTLSATAVTEIPISGEQAQGNLEGLCSMGMYSFTVRFL